MKKYFIIVIIGLLCINIQCTTSNPFANRNHYSYQEIDIELIRDQIIVKVSMNGKPLNMMLDTGGNPSLISTELGLEFNTIDTTKWGYASGVGDEKIKIYPAKMEDLEIKELKYEAISAIAMNLDEISKKLGIKLSGILGYSFLSDNIIQIDYPARKLRIYTPETKFKIDENYKTYQIFPLKFPTGKTIPLIESVKINNYLCSATLDTGSSLNLDIRSYLLDSIGIDNSTVIKGEKVIGASGQEDVYLIKINSIEIGSKKLKEDKMITVIEEDALDPDEVSVNIGNGLLKDHIITFDYINGIILFE